MWSTEWNAGASAVIKSREDEAATARSSAYVHLGWLQEIQAVRVPWTDCVLEPSQDRVKGHCKKETTRWTTLSHTSGQKELSPSCSREFHMRGTVVVNSS